jgi:hypothetical protein
MLRLPAKKAAGSLPLRLPRHGAPSGRFSTPLTPLTCAREPELDHTKATDMAHRSLKPLIRRHKVVLALFRVSDKPILRPKEWLGSFEKRMRALSGG